MKKLFILAAAAVAFAACSNNESDNQVQNPDNVIRLNSYVGDITRAGSNLLSSQFENAMTINVHVTDNAAENKKTYTDAIYTSDGNGALTTLTPQYYPASGSSVDIYAYYPSDASTATDGFAVGTDQSNDNAYKTCDLMYATISGMNKTNQASKNTLSFAHKMAKFNVTLVAGDGMGAEEIATAMITLKDVIYKGTFVPATGVFTAANGEVADNKSDIIVATNAGTTQHSAVVVPQDMAGKKIEIKIGEQTVEYTFPAASSNFAPNTHNDYTITIANSGITVTSTIGPWDNGSTGSDTLTY